jgi:hypothetical protein
MVTENPTKHDPRAAIDALQPVWRSKVSGELPIDLNGSPIGCPPRLDCIPKLSALIATHTQDSAIAKRFDPDIAFLIDFEPMIAWQMMQPTSIPLEVHRSGSECLDHPLDVQELHDKLFHDNLLRS